MTNTDIIYNFFFILFSLGSVISGVCVILSRNPIHSVLFLMLSFLNVSGLFILLGCEFLGFLFIMVYVGAVTVLFLFVVMMLNIRFSEWYQSLYRYWFVGLILWILFILEVYWIYNYELVRDPMRAYYRVEPILNVITGQSNVYTEVMSPRLSDIKVFGIPLYESYGIALYMAGLVLLVALIGAIVLTLQSKENIKRQSILTQIRRNIIQSLKRFK